MANFENKDALLDAIKDVRADNTETNWVLAGHVDNQVDVVRLAGSGKGGLEEMLNFFDDNAVMYGLLRVSQKIDLSTTVKFVYIYFIGENVPALQRGKIGTAHFEVNQLFSPFHIDFDISKASEIDDEKILQKIEATTGKVNKVRDVSDDKSHERGFTSTTVKEASKKESKFGFQGQNEEAKSGSTVPIAQEVIEGIADVRNDKSETNWVLASYEENNVKKGLVFTASGNGGVDEIIPLLLPQAISYGLIRITDVIEGIKTVKFAFLYFIGGEVSIMNKAKVATNKGSVVTAFSPFHVTFEFSLPGELSDQSLLALVQDTSGSKSHVK